MTPYEQSVQREADAKQRVIDDAKQRVADTEQRIADAKQRNREEAVARDEARRRKEYAEAQRELGPRIAGTVPDEPLGRPPARPELPPLPEPEKEKPPEESDVVTRKDVAAALNSLIKTFEQRFVTHSANRKFQDEVLKEISQSDFVTEDEAKTIANEAVPATLRGLDSSESARTGNQLLLSPAGDATDDDGNTDAGGDSAYWGTVVAGLKAKGDKVLYKGIFLREYDASGTLVAAGSDIDPGNYGSQAAYEAALTAANHTLKYTNDWARVGTDI